MGKRAQKWPGRWVGIMRQNVVGALALLLALWQGPGHCREFNRSNLSGEAIEALTPLPISRAVRRGREREPTSMTGAGPFGASPPRPTSTSSAPIHRNMLRLSAAIAPTPCPRASRPISTPLPLRSSTGAFTSLRRSNPGTGSSPIRVPAGSRRQLVGPVEGARSLGATARFRHFRVCDRRHNAHAWGCWRLPSARAI